MDTLPPGDAETIRNMSYAQLKSELDRTHPTANPVWRLGIFERINYLDAKRNNDDQKTQKDIRTIALLTLAVGIIVLIVTLFQLFK
jgi:hypothetical protein